MLAQQSLRRVCPCVAGRCLTASLSHAKTAATTCISSRNISTTSNNTSESIFSPNASPWDEIFEDVKTSAAATGPPTTMNPRSLKHGMTGRVDKPRAYAMRQDETVALVQMFNAVFEGGGTNVPGAPGIGQVRTPMQGLFSKLRQGGRRVRWTSKEDQDLDRKKEEMELCETDLQLLEWAMREVFGESRRYEEEARRAAEETNTSSVPAPRARSSALELQPASYPHLLAALMRTFRDKYKDPHLALAIFDHARNLSTVSYVFGCTTPAYNELIETRWRCFRDLPGVCNALEEMQVNVIPLDNRTRLLAETIRREVGERSLWQEEGSLGSGEVWEMIGRLERLSVLPTRKPRPIVEPRKRAWRSDQESWKAKAMEIGAKDGWTFGQWGPSEANGRSSFGTEKRAMRY